MSEHDLALWQVAFDIAMALCLAAVLAKLNWRWLGFPFRRAQLVTAVKDNQRPRTSRTYGISLIEDRETRRWAEHE